MPHDMQADCLVFDGFTLLRILQIILSNRLYPGCTAESWSSILSHSNSCVQVCHPSCKGLTWLQSHSGSNLPLAVFLCCMKISKLLCLIKVNILMGWLSLARLASSKWFIYHNLAMNRLRFKNEVKQTCHSLKLIRNVVVMEMSMACTVACSSCVINGLQFTMVSVVILYSVKCSDVVLEPSRISSELNQEKWRFAQALCSCKRVKIVSNQNKMMCMSSGIEGLKNDSASVNNQKNAFFEVQFFLVVSTLFCWVAKGKFMHSRLLICTWTWHLMPAAKSGPRMLAARLQQLEKLLQDFVKLPTDRKIVVFHSSRRQWKHFVTVSGCVCLHTNRC